MRQVLDDLAAEEPLEIRIAGKPLTVTMRTPGDDFELAAGFLLSEGLITARDQIARIGFADGPDGQPSGNLVDVRLAENVTIEIPALDRHFLATSSCGVCGKTSIEAVRARPIPDLGAPWSVDPALLTRLPDALRARQRIFGRTGGLHAAALFDRDGTLVAIREDIGRHNAVDKIIGHALLTGAMPLADRILMVSGRGGFEIVQKALVAGIPIVASVSAPSSLAVQLAREHGLTLIGFLRASRFIVYSGDQRLRQPGRY